MIDRRTFVGAAAATVVSAPLFAMPAAPGGGRSVASRAALAAAAPGGPIDLLEQGRAGGFAWRGGDFSRFVTADVAQGLFVAPTGDPSGLSGAWARILPDPMVVDLAMFGGGVAQSDTANTVALLCFRNVMREINRPVTLNLPPGDLRYKTARWLQGVSSCTVNGGPTRLFNTLVADARTERIPLLLNQDIFLGNAGAQQDGFGTFEKGDRIASARAGATTVHLIEPPSLRHRPGDWVLLYGWNMSIVGYPPCPRTFQYNRIRAADPSRGLVELVDPLRAELREDWPDLLTTGKAEEAIGAARLLNLSRPDFKIAEQIKLNDLELMPSPGASPDDSILSGSLFCYSGIDIMLNRVTINGYFYPSMSKRIHARNCRIRAMEIDKVLDELVMEDCDLGAWGNGPGCNFFHFVGGRMLEPAISALTARRTIIEGTELVFGPSRLHQFFQLGASTNVDSIAILRPKVLGSGYPLVNGGGRFSITVKAVPAHGTIQLAFTGTLPDPAFRSVGVNTLLRCGSKEIRVECVYVRDGLITIEGPWNGSEPPRPGDVYEGNMVRELVIEGPVTIQRPSSRTLSSALTPFDLPRPPQVDDLIVRRTAGRQLGPQRKTPRAASS